MYLLTQFSFPCRLICANLLVIGANSLGDKRELNSMMELRYFPCAISCCSRSSWMPPSLASLHAAWYSKLSILGAGSICGALVVSLTLWLEFDRDIEEDDVECDPLKRDPRDVDVFNESKISYCESSFNEMLRAAKIEFKLNDEILKASFDYLSINVQIQAYWSLFPSSEPSWASPDNFRVNQCYSIAKAG